MALPTDSAAPAMIGSWKNSSDYILPVCMILILGIMILPVPPIFMDFLLSVSITLAVMILMVGFFIERPLDFSVFPGVLLMSTLFRLALNIASTRLILLKGDQGPGAAGKVIESFGMFVVGGEYAVGIIVFTILVVINFVVITKGSGRIAEVAARFTLDAMPGKQMAIDADLNTGLIGEEEARKRREKIENEAEFYGSMDGASKFVRGDATAGIIITAINILGGLIIGVAAHDMPIAEAAETYTLLTIGDGLVSQIPALLISTSAGIVATRAGTEADLGEAFRKQMLSNSKVLFISSGVLLAMSLVPGLPHLSFMVLGGLTGMLGYRVARKQPEEIPEEEDEAPVDESLWTMEPVDLISMDVGYQLVPMVDASQGGVLLEQIRSLRRQMVRELGFLVPPIHIKDNLQLGPSEYRIYIRESEVGTGEIQPDTCMAINPGSAQPGLEGVPVQEPVFGLTALSIPEQDKEKAQMMGYTVVDAAAVIVTHLAEVIRGHSSELLTRQDVHELLQELAKENPKVVEELVPNQLPLGVVHRALQGLLEERVSIRDLLTVLETLGDQAVLSKDSELLVEYARQALARQISREHKGEDGSITAIVLDPRWEEKITQAVVTTNQGSFAAMEPAEVRNLVNHVKKGIEEGSQMGQLPVLLTTPELRRFVRKLLNRFIPNLSVLSYNEITPDTRLVSVNR